MQILFNCSIALLLNCFIALLLYCFIAGLLINNLAMQQWNNLEKTNQYKGNEVTKEYFLTWVLSYKQKRGV